MKKLMILGATLTQVPLIETAKKLGIYTIVASIPGNYPAFDHADEVCYVDITDMEAVYNKAKELNIDGIVTCCMDLPVRAVGYVSEKMGLQGLHEHAAILCNDKSLMKSAFEEYGVQTPKYVRIDSKEELIESMKKLNFPLIIKAVDLQASRGIYVAKNKQEAIDGFEKAMKLTKQDFCIVEEYIEGEEFGAQAFVYNGEVLYVLPHGDYTYYTHTAMPIGHFMPLNLSDDIIQSAKIEAEKAIKAVGLNNCAVNIDMIYKDGKVYMIELTGRAGATNLCELVSIYFGIDYYEMIAKTAIGEDPRKVFNKRSNTPTACASKYIISLSDGILEAIQNNNVDDKNICEYKIFVKKGDKINNYGDGKDRLGHVIVKGKTIEECMQTLDNYCDKIQIVLK